MEQTDKNLTTEERLICQKLNGLKLQQICLTIERLNIYAVLPNQDGTFCCQKALFEDSGVPLELKDSIFDSIGINYKDMFHKFT